MILSWLRRAPLANIFLALNLAFIFIIFIWGGWPGAFQAEISSRDLAYYNGRSISFIGRVCEEADVDIKSRRLTVCVSGQAQGKVLVTTNLYPPYDYGDFLKISGQLQAPPEIDGFDYESYLARYDIYSVMYRPRISVIAGKLSAPQLVYKILIGFKQGLKLIIDFNLPEPAAGLANAILLGYRRTVERSDLDIFSRVGLSHMIAISGSHITILSALAVNFFLGLGLSRRRAMQLIFIFLFLYPLMTGLSASAVRSSIMGGLAFAAIYYQRPSSLLRALVFSASLMLVFNPRLLRDDIGFQLSFLALLGIIYIYPLSEGLIGSLLNKLKLSYRSKKMVRAVLDTLNLTMVSQIVILPIALINFRQLSLIAPLANILVLWTFPPLLFLLILAILLSFLSPGLGLIWFWPVYLLLKFIFTTANMLATPSWASADIAYFNWYWGGAYYLSLIILVVIFRRLARSSLSKQKTTSR